MGRAGGCGCSGEVGGGGGGLGEGGAACGWLLGVVGGWRSAVVAVGEELLLGSWRAGVVREGLLLLLLLGWVLLRLLLV